MALRLAVLTAIWLLAFASLTFASSSSKPAAKKLKLTPPPPKPAEAVATLVVPDVQRQPYVFAKGILEDAGFAWRVVGEVQGYAANIVVLQTPLPGTRISGEGTPTVILKLERNPDYEERGLPQNESPYEGTGAVELADAPKPPKALKARAKVAAAKPKPKKQAQAAALDARAEGAARKPAFVVAGAPPEPANEMPLPDRARMIGRHLAAHPYPTKKIVKWWLYQHAWVVTGAKFGWSEGDKALRILIKVDRDLYKRWGIGLKSAAVAEDALRDVERELAR